MTLDPSAQPGAFADRRPITEEEVLKLRAEVWRDGSIAPGEAERLFELNDSVVSTPEWTDFFVEAITEHLTSRNQPHGYVSDEDAGWLMSRLNRDGRIETVAELELIVKLLERAEYAPEALKQFALKEIEQTVLTGSGPTRSGGGIAPGRIDDAEVRLLRRLIFAAAGDGPAKVSQAEAELLFRLKDATLGAANSADWQQLFVKGIANYLMAHQDYVPPSREEELRLEQAYEPNTLGFLTKMMGRPASRGEVRDVVFGEDQDKAIAAHQAAVAADAEVTPAEADWLKRLFDRDGARDEMEQALLDFLAEDGARPF